jgi:hypothetical protein
MRIVPGREYIVRNPTEAGYLAPHVDATVEVLHTVHESKVDREVAPMWNVRRTDTNEEFSVFEDELREQGN